jgi:hypothetical protein
LIWTRSFRPQEPVRIACMVKSIPSPAHKRFQVTVI